MRFISRYSVLYPVLYRYTVRAGMGTIFWLIVAGNSIITNVSHSRCKAKYIEKALDNPLKIQYNTLRCPGNPGDKQRMAR